MAWFGADFIEGVGWIPRGSPVEPAPSPAPQQASSNVFTPYIPYQNAVTPRASGYGYNVQTQPAQQKAQPNLLDILRQSYNAANKPYGPESGKVGTNTPTETAGPTPQQVEQQTAASRQVYTAEPRRLTWDEYYALDDKQRSAVDYNGMLFEAQQKDRAGVPTYDTDGSGSTSLKEVGKSADAGYKKAYSNAFGREATDETEYAANTMGLLNALRMKDYGASGVRDYSGSSGFITADDMQTLNAPMEAGDRATSTPGVSNSRNTMVDALATSMMRWQQTISQGSARISGNDVKMTATDQLSNEQRSALVDSMRKSLATPNAAVRMTGEGDWYDPTSGVDLSPMIDPTDRGRIAKMDYIYNLATKGGADDAGLSNRETLVRMKFGDTSDPTNVTAGIPLEEWLQYMENRKRIGSGEKDMAALGNLGNK